MPQIMIVAEAKSARRLVSSLRAKGISVSQVGNAGRDSSSSRVELFVKVPTYRLQEAYETIAAGS